MYIYHYTTVNKYPIIIYWVSLSNNFTHNHKYIDKAFMQYKFSLFFKQMVGNKLQFMYNWYFLHKIFKPKQNN